jgi:hypothetical protein
VRHARPVRHRRHGVAPFLLGQPVGQEGIEDVADRKRDPERGQDAAEEDVVPDADDGAGQEGQHQDVQQHVRAEPEERVDVAGDP